MDLGFAERGMFVLPATALRPAVPGGNAISSGDFAVELESGKLLMSGFFRYPLATQQTGLLVRLFPNGALDPSFVQNGVLDFTGSTTESVIGTRLVALPADAVVWAHFDTRLCNPACEPFDPEQSHVFLRRLTATGFAQPTYAFGGTATGRIVPSDLVANPDGSVVAFGQRVSASAPFLEPAIAAFDANGRVIDSARLPDLPNGHCAVAGDSTTRIRATRQPDGKVLAVWASKPASGQELCLVRLDARGDPDASFGAGGLSIVSGVPGADVAVAILARRDGGSVGVFNVFDGAVRGNELVFFDAAGRVDATRGQAGVHRDVETGIQAITAAALQPDEKILVAGTTVGGGRPGVSRIARFDPDGGLDRGFADYGTGVAELLSAARTLIPAHVMVASDWSIFVTGTYPCPFPPAVCGTQSSLAIMKVIGGER